MLIHQEKNKIEKAMIATAATEQDHMTARGGGRAKGEERERDNTQEKFGWF